MPRFDELVEQIVEAGGIGQEAVAVADGERERA